MPERSLDWIAFDRYLAMHDRMVDRALSYFAVESMLVVPDMITPRLVRIHGDLVCRGGLVVRVDNYYRRDASDRIQGVVYRYHAQFIEPPLRRIFRYDNDHTYNREAHPDAFHKHLFSDRTWREVEVVHIGRENFPTLAEVIDEL